MAGSLCTVSTDDLNQRTTSININTSLSKFLFIKQFHEDPQSLLSHLKEKLLQSLKNYEKECPKQPQIVQQCLLEFRYKVPHILDNYECTSSNATEKTQRQLWLLYGLIWQMMSRDKSLAFKGALENVFENIALDRDEAISFLKLFQSRQYGQRDLTNAEWFKECHKKYQAARTALKKKVLALEDLCDGERNKLFDELLDNVKAIMRIIDRAVIKAMNGKHPMAFDYKFHTHVLKKTHAVLNDPFNENLRNDYRKLTRLVEDAGKSYGCLLSGAMLVVLSSAALIASLILKFATASLGTGLTLPIMIAASVGLFSGSALIQHGRKRGLRLACHQFNRHLENPKMMAFWQSRHANQKPDSSLKAPVTEGHQTIEFSFLKHK